MIFKNVLQLKITLRGSKPSINRVIYFPSDATFMDLHAAIQLAMGWSSLHLYQFVKNRTLIGLPDEEFNTNCLDLRKTKIAEFLFNEKDKIVYEYDFGDSWIHDLEVQKTIKDIELLCLPYLKSAKMACPFEDCGGIDGYNHIISILSNPKHPDFEDIAEMYDEEFDPKFFDDSEVNDLFGIFDEVVQDQLDNAKDMLG